MNSRPYAAFLRGINVGQKIVKMQDLKKEFETLGYRDVRTLLNSGNVLFEAPDKDITFLTHDIEAALEKGFGFPIKTILRPLTKLQSLIASEPFKAIAVTPQIRLYVTFLSEKPSGNLKLPAGPSDKGFKIIQVTDMEVYSVVTLSERIGTTDAMEILEKEFGKNITTRNWNTVTKLLSK